MKYTTNSHHLDISQRKKSKMPRYQKKQTNCERKENRLNKAAGNLPSNNREATRRKEQDFFMALRAGPYGKLYQAVDKLDQLSLG